MIKPEFRQPKLSEMPILRKLLRKYGDNLREEEVIKATSPSTRKQWIVAIANGEIAGAGKSVCDSLCDSWRLNFDDNQWL